MFPLVYSTPLGGDSAGHCGSGPDGRTQWCPSISPTEVSTRRVGGPRSYPQRVDSSPCQLKRRPARARQVITEAMLGSFNQNGDGCVYPATAWNTKDFPAYLRRQEAYQQVRTDSRTHSRAALGLLHTTVRP